MSQTESSLPDVDSDITGIPAPELQRDISLNKTRKRNYDEEILQVLKEGNKRQIRERVIDEDESFLLSLVPSFKKYNEEQKLLLRIELMNTIVRFGQSQRVSNCGKSSFHGPGLGLVSVQPHMQQGYSTFGAWAQQQGMLPTPSINPVQQYSPSSWVQQQGQSSHTATSTVCPTVMSPSQEYSYSQESGHSVEYAKGSNHSSELFELGHLDEN